MAFSLLQIKEISYNLYHNQIPSQHEGINRKMDELVQIWNENIKQSNLNIPLLENVPHKYNCHTFRYYWSAWFERYITLFNHIDGRDIYKTLFDNLDVEKTATINDKVKNVENQIFLLEKKYLTREKNYKEENEIMKKQLEKQTCLLESCEEKVQIMEKNLVALEGKIKDLSETQGYMEKHISTMEYYCNNLRLSQNPLTLPSYKDSVYLDNVANEAIMNGVGIDNLDFN